MRLPFGVPKIAPRLVRTLAAALSALLAAPASYGQVRTIELTEQASAKPVALSCTVGRTTRIFFPEPSRRLKVSAGGKERLGVRFVATNPQAVVEASPQSAGATGTIEFTGPSGILTILVTAVDSEAPSEIRLVHPRAPATSPPQDPRARAPTATPLKRPTLAPPPTPTHSPAPTPSAVAPPPDLSPRLRSASTQPEAPQQVSPRQPVETPALLPAPSPTANVPTLDVSELLQLRPVVIGRREGLPGQRPLILEDALKSEVNIWLRFRLVGGGSERVGQISWEHGPLSSFLQTIEGKDLRLIVKLPRSSVSKKTRVRIRLEGEKADRTFSLDSPWLSSFLRSLVR